MHGNITSLLKVGNSKIAGPKISVIRRFHCIAFAIANI